MVRNRAGREEIKTKNQNGFQLEGCSVIIFTFLLAGEFTFSSNSIIKFLKQEILFKK